MVLSNKKLKQRLGAESGGQQGSVLLSPGKPKTVNKREKRRQRRQQPESIPAHHPASPETSPIALTELDTYHRCIESLLHKGDLSSSLGQGQDAEDVPLPPRSPVKKSQDAEVSLAPLTNNEQNTLNVENSSLPTPHSKSRKRKKASKTTEEPDEKDHSTKDQDLSESRTVYVGGIPYYSSEDDIKAFFGDCGTISEVNLKTFSDSGKFRGIALLTFKTVGGAQRALALDGSSMGDRFLKIQPAEAKPKEPVKKEVFNTPPSKTDGYMRAYIDDESLERSVQLDQQMLLERPIKVAYAVPTRAEKRATATKDRKDIVCHTCGEKGHVSSRCPYMGRG
ncbi:hypothetical protein GOP47_0014984 [Adiantum capillus-veneris]|uniref:Uncharacterized protein n=1 Tax=Adiantum capillus-veneris TaxID=13818 RepID=A0A9D4UMJ5_ADICA|nr:hypothetical protein GOP47_0014984 [Adiantum capillus-veneris]